MAVMKDELASSVSNLVKQNNEAVCGLQDSIAKLNTSIREDFREELTANANASRTHVVSAVKKQEDQIEEQRKVTDRIVNDMNRMSLDEDRESKRARRDLSGTPGSASAPASGPPRCLVSRWKGLGPRASRGP